MTVWDQLIGQGEAVRTLFAAAQAASAIDRGESTVAVGGISGGTDASPAAPAGAGGTGAMTHAWLFTGPPGSGRSVAARAFAASLQCERPDDLGCGACAGCRTVLARTHPDVHSVVPEGLSIGVEEMRGVVARTARRPARGHWQVVLIEDADRLTEGASNALLKAVEEPPARTVMLLCAPSLHPDDVSVTLRSRCRLVTLRTPAAADVASVLIADGIDAETAQWAAAAGQGHVGRSRRLAKDSDARERRAEVLAIPASLTSLGACIAAAEQLERDADAEAKAIAVERDEGETEGMRFALGLGGTGKGTATMRGAAGALKELERKQQMRGKRTVRDSLDRALVDLAGFYRDVLLHQAGSSVPPAHPDVADDVVAVSLQLDAVAVLQRLDAILACREALDLNVKPKVALHAMTAALRI